MKNAHKYLQTSAFYPAQILQYEMAINQICNDSPHAPGDNKVINRNESPPPNKKCYLEGCPAVIVLFCTKFIGKMKHLQKRGILLVIQLNTFW